jgi:hypothetical protein
LDIESLRHVDTMVKASFPTTMDGFKKAGCLHPTLITMTATLIASYTCWKGKYGTMDPMISKLEPVFRETDGLNLDKLACWSSDVKARFYIDNPDVLPVERLDEVICSLNQNVTMVLKNAFEADRTGIQRNERLGGETRNVTRQH